MYVCVCECIGSSNGKMGLLGHFREPSEENKLVTDMNVYFVYFQCYVKGVKGETKMIEFRENEQFMVSAASSNGRDETSR